MEKKCTVLIPAYEPEETMIALLKELRETTDWSVVIVDDGSGPDFAPLFETARQYALVTGYTENHGKGYALRRGMVYIKQYLPDTEIILTMDADGQHKVPDAVRVVKKSAALGRSLVIGSRAFANLRNGTVIVFLGQNAQIADDAFAGSDIFFVCPYGGTALNWLREKGYPVYVTFYH